ncbi:SLAP domain-containing protein [Companilactobacillus huachuanensis]|uniref:SLAP domain-containing protein n=1 Tax=Companilactobacillus huachuanensis TaxID=2559914 RepID=A0ABW1RPU1_9LACO|nr:SLAP domain-containing protein [Companilactobacillus huachuanensis]
MKRFTQVLLFSSLLALGAGATAISGPTTAKADDNYYGYTAIATSVVTVRDTGAQIYNSYGIPTGKYLPMNSEWKTNLENTLYNGSYYGIGTDEYVKASDVHYKMEAGFSGNGIQSAGNYDGVVVTSDYGAALYDASGSPIGKTLPDGSVWKIDQINNVDSGTYYRVGSGEYVSGTDVRVYEAGFTRATSQVITTRPGPPTALYDVNGQLITDRALAPNTKWYADEISNTGGVGYLRVATNEYVIAADVY